MRNLVFFLLFCASKSSAQPIFSLKFAPIYALNPFQETVYGGVDIPISSRLGLELCAGHVFNSTNSAQFKGESFKGFKLKPSLKYFFGKQKPRNTYVSFSLKYSQIDHEYFLEVARQGFQYTEKMLLHRRVDVRGAAIGLGENVFFGKQNQWLFEPFFSLGIRKKHIYFTNVPPDGEVVVPRGFVRTSGTFIGLDLMVGFHVGWVLFGQKPRASASSLSKVTDFLLEKPNLRERN